MPLPPNVKAFKNGALDTQEEMEDDRDIELDDANPSCDDEDTMDSTASSSNQPTSNLIEPDSLKKQQQLANFVSSTGNFCHKKN